MHRYQLELAAGDFLEVEVEQLGVDLRVAVVDPNGVDLFEVDSPYGDRETEVALLIAENPGRYICEIRTGRSGKGAYRIRVVTRRQATVADQLRTAAALYYDRGEHERRGGSVQEALKPYRQAAETWHAVGDRLGEALALHRIGQVQVKLGHRDAALVAYREAAHLAGLAGRLVRLADLLYGAGKIHFEGADYGQAIAKFRGAADLYVDLQDPARQAHALNRIAWAQERLGDLDAAQESYRQSLAIGKDRGDLNWQGTELNNLGEVELRLGRPEVALEHFEEAMELRRRTADVRGEAVTLTSLGTALRRMGKLEPARERFLTAREIQSQLDDRAMLANTLVGLGLTELALGDLEQAEGALRRAVQVADEVGQNRTAAAALLNLGEVYEARGQHHLALQQVDQALPLLQRLGDLQGEASAAFAAARNERSLGHLESSRQWLELAIERIETVRIQTRPDLLRVSYFAFKHRYYEAYLDLLMELHRRDPGRGFDAMALQASERSRARVLLDSLAPSEFHSVEAGVFREHQADLARQRAGTAEGYPALAAVGLTPGSSWNPSPVPAIEELQNHVLGPGTLLLEIALGETRSHLWALDADSLATYLLPGRPEIEALARQAQRALARSRQRGARVQAWLALADLSRMILGPIADRLDHRRLVIVTDGALQALPFAVLLDPRSLEGQEPSALVETHEVVMAPSAAVVQALRDRPRRWGGTLALIANPVFSIQDPRLPAAQAVNLANTGRAPARPPDLPLLPFSGEEAAAILAVTPPGERLVALGFDANLGLVQSGVLARYRFLHFATHGFVDAEHPDRSYLALSHFDGQGRPSPGMLEAREIAQLTLTAELVVLSACRTAVGPDARGEGMMSLGRVFLLAGAARVLVSLWQVDDQATAVLMEHFYRALLLGGESPAAALRAAQLAMQAEERWQAPYYWAGFVLQGDWR